MMMTEVEDVSLILRTRYPRNVAFIYCYESTYFLTLSYSGGLLGNSTWLDLAVP